mmetsp:Transcript_8140/g.16589  ORF Transcript_8140/g.16589 Transcript_8140/m.16589 type:complete len:217 (+) Transcript_8140:356-1006(+)
MILSLYPGSFAMPLPMTTKRLRFFRPDKFWISVMFVSLLPVSTNVSTFGMLASKFFDILITRLLFSKSVFSLGRSGNPSNFTISLSDRSMLSNWFSVPPRFSIAEILFPRRSISYSLQAFMYCGDLRMSSVVSRPDVPSAGANILSRASESREKPCSSLSALSFAALAVHPSPLGAPRASSFTLCLFALRAPLTQSGLSSPPLLHSCKWQSAGGFK